MGLHETKNGTYYAQREPDTGRLMQVLPVRADKRSVRLPSISALGLDQQYTETRVGHEAQGVQAGYEEAKSRHSLQYAGGSNLMDTGRSVLGERNRPISYSQQGSPPQEHEQYAQHAQYAQYAQYAPNARNDQHTHAQYAQSSQQHPYDHRHNYTLNKDAASSREHSHLVRSWHDSHPHQHSETLHRPPTHSATGTVTGASHGPVFGRDSGDRYGQHGRDSPAERARTHSRARSGRFSVSSLMTDDAGSNASTYSASEALTPKTLSPVPEFYRYGSPNSHSSSPVPPNYASLSHGVQAVMHCGPPGHDNDKAHSHGHHHQHTYNHAPVHSAPVHSAPVHSAPVHSAPAPAPSRSESQTSRTRRRPLPSSAIPTKKARDETIWVISSLEPRKLGPNGEDIGGHRSQRTTVHIERSYRYPRT